MSHETELFKERTHSPTLISCNTVNKVKILRNMQLEHGDSDCMADLKILAQIDMK